MTDQEMADYLRENGYPEHLVRAGRAGLIARWRRFVEEVEKGYGFTIYDYRNDLDLRGIIAMLGLEELSTEDQRTVNRARRLERFLTQPFFLTEEFTGRSGRHVPLDVTLRGCESILSGELDDTPEEAFFMIGGIGEVH